MAPFIVSSDGTTASASSLPTQQQLAQLAETHRSTLQDLCISSEPVTAAEPLDFTKIGSLPVLKQLTLNCVEVSSITFTQTNTPALEKLTLENINWDGDAHLFLDLPLLTPLSAQYIELDGTNNSFADSLNRCPLLEEVFTYKCKVMTGRNFCVLPNVQRLTLHRAECTHSLVILSAPKLTQLSIQAAYDLSHLRLWDLPAATTADALDLNKPKGRKKPPSTFEMPDKKSFGDSRTVKCLMDAIRARKLPEGCQQSALPACEVVVVNMTISDDTRAHLEANGRVTVTGNDEEDEFDHGMIVL